MEWKEIESNEEDEGSEDSEEEWDEDAGELEEELEPESSFDQGFEEEQFQPRPGSAQVNPFLEAEPIENLEQDLQDVPTQIPGTETGGLQEQGYSDVAAQYAEAGAYEEGVGAYEGGVNYEDTRVTGAPETDINRALRIRPSDVTLNTNLDGQREMNFSRWQKHAMDSYPGQRDTQEERYIPAPRKQDITTGLPFQNKKNPKRF